MLRETTNARISAYPVARFAVYPEGSLVSVWKSAGMDKPDLTVAELRSAIERLLDTVESELGPALSFREDYYWNIPCQSACVLDSAPLLDVGSVGDDVDSIREFLSRDLAEPTMIWHESEHIGGILRAITRLDLSH